MDMTNQATVMGRLYNHLSGHDSSAGFRLWGQFGAIILSEPEIGPAETPPGGGWHFVRVHFKIWPGQGDLIETTFRQQIVSTLKTLHPEYAGWQVPVTYRKMPASKQLQGREMSKNS